MKLANTPTSDRDQRQADSKRSAGTSTDIATAGAIASSMPTGEQGRQHRQHDGLEDQRRPAGARVETPIAFSAAKSRVRSSTDR